MKKKDNNEEMSKDNIRVEDTVLINLEGGKTVHSG